MTIQYKYIYTICFLGKRIRIKRIKGADQLAVNNYKNDLKLQ